jgi:hypothetical protein
MEEHLPWAFSSPKATRQDHGVALLLQVKPTRDPILISNVELVDHRNQ